MHTPTGTRRDWVGAMGAATGAALLAGCGGTDEQGDTPRDTPPDFVDRTFVTTEFNTIYNNNYNPYDALYHPNQSPAYLFGSLFSRSRSTDRLIPGVARNMIRDGDVVDVELDPNYLWHNGDPVVADHLVAKWTLDMLAERRNWEMAFDDVQKVDEHTARIEVVEDANDYLVEDFVSTTLMNTHPEVYGQFLPDNGKRGKGTYSDIPSFELTTLRGNLLTYTVRGQYDPDDPEGTVLGCGPWKMRRHGQREMVYEVFEDHPNADSINFPRVKFLEFTSNQARYQALLSDNFGGLDLVLTQTVWDELPDHYKKYSIDWMHGMGLAINYDRYPDRRVRQALAYAIDRQRTVNNSGIAEPLYEIHTFDSALLAPKERHDELFGDDFVDDVLVQYDHDPETATTLLEDAGWSKSDGRWYNEDGDRAQLTIRTPPTWPEWVNMIQTAVQDLNDFGIDADFETQELVVYYGNTMVQADYDLAAWWIGAARPSAWFAYNTAWNAIQTVADTHKHPDVYEDVPMPIGDPDGESESVDRASLLEELASSRMDSDRAREVRRRLGWTFNQMMPVYCLIDYNGCASLKTKNWQGPPLESEAGNIFFPFSHMNHHGLINARP